MTTSRIPMQWIAALAGALLLAGCGVKGPLEPPPGSTAPAGAVQNPATVRNVQPDQPGPSVTSTRTEVQSNNAVISPLSQPKKSRKKKGNVPITSDPVVPNEPFVLDSLL